MSDDMEVRITLLANAGLLLQYKGSKILLDGIYCTQSPFSNLREDTWDALLKGEGPFEQIDYLIFTHEHSDHFSPEMTRTYLMRQKVKGVFFPSTNSPQQRDLCTYLAKQKIPFYCLTRSDDHKWFPLNDQITVLPYFTRHVGKLFGSVPHCCYLISFGDKRFLFTADVDYTWETLEGLPPLTAVFLNPLFLGALHTNKFFKGRLFAHTFCIYHIPSPEDDLWNVLPVLRKNCLEWDIHRGKVVPFEKPYQQERF